MVVIATADVNDEYEATLQETLLRLKPRSIVDLSAIPALSGNFVKNLNYINMYDDEFLRFIEENNKHLAPKLPILLSDIKETLHTAQILSPPMAT
ncbi:MAG: hypothetical protein E5W13_19555 [Mesorhizobium sp.]|nr:MAG: hypothetical protein E5W13_19555 [Mesorhizobium sp.]